MLKIIKRAKNVLLWNEIIISLVLVVFILTTFSAIKLGSLVKGLRMDVAAATLEASRLEAVHNEFLTLKSSIERIEDQQAKLIALVPTRKGILDNIEGLEAVANKTSNVQQISILDTPPDPKKKTAAKPNPVSKIVTVPQSIQMVDYRIELTGGFANLMSYLKLFENQPFLTFVREVSLTADTDKISNSNINFNTGNVNTRIDGTFFFVDD